MGVFRSLTSLNKAPTPEQPSLKARWHLRQCDAALQMGRSVSATKLPFLGSRTEGTMTASCSVDTSLLEAPRLNVG